MLRADDRVDICLSDYRLPDGDGLGLLAQIRLVRPTIAVGILCAEPGPTLAEEVRALGGVACLPKQMATPDLVRAVNALFDGEEAFPDRAPTDGGRPLSERRRRILLYASRGWPDKQISEALGISESTVRNHWHHIFLRLRVTNRTEAVSQALRQNLI